MVVIIYGNAITNIQEEEIVTKKANENYEQEDSYRNNVKDIIKKKESLIKNDSIDKLITPLKKTSHPQPKRLSQDLLSKFGNFPTNLKSKVDLVSKNDLDQVVEQDIESKDTYSPINTVSLSDFDQNKDDQATGQSNLLCRCLNRGSPGRHRNPIGHSSRAGCPRKWPRGLFPV